MMNSRGINIEPRSLFINIENIKLCNNVSIGRGAYFNADGGSIFVGNGTSFNNDVSLNSAISGKINIGKNCMIANRVCMRTVNHNYKDKSRLIKEQGYCDDDVIIGDDVWIGMAALILPGAKIGNGAVIGAGSVVLGPIPEFSVAVGVPAKVIGYRS